MRFAGPSRIYAATSGSRAPDLPSSYFVNNLLPYFRSIAAVITYLPAAYVRVEWHPVAATAAELRAVYDHVLHAMRRHQAPALLSVHNQRPPIPPDVQTWLVNEWIPRALEAGYRYCAIVEAVTPLGRLSARAVGSSLDKTALQYRYFRTETAAEEWLLEEIHN